MIRSLSAIFGKWFSKVRKADSVIEYDENGICLKDKRSLDSRFIGKDVNGRKIFIVNGVIFEAEDLFHAERIYLGSKNKGAK